MFEPTIMRTPVQLKQSLQKLAEHRSFCFDEKKCLADAIQELENLNKSNDHQFSKDDIPDLIRVILARPAATSSSSADLKFQNLSKYTSELAKNRFSSRFFPCADKKITRSTAFLLFWLYAATHNLNDVFSELGDPRGVEYDKNGKQIFKNPTGGKFLKGKFSNWLKEMCPKASVDADDLFKNLDSYIKYFAVSKYTSSKDEYLLHFKDHDLSLKKDVLKYDLFACGKTDEEKPGVIAADTSKEPALERTGNSTFSSLRLRSLSISELGSSSLSDLTNRLKTYASSVWRAYYFNPNSYPIRYLRDPREKFFSAFPNGLRRRRRVVPKQDNPLLVGAPPIATNAAAFFTPAEIYDHFLRNQSSVHEIDVAKGIQKKPEQDKQILGNELVLRRQQVSSSSASRVYKTIYKLEGLMLKYLQACQYNPNFDPHFKVQPFFGFPDGPRNRRRAAAALVPVVPRQLEAPPAKKVVIAESNEIFSTPLPESVCDKPKPPVSLTLGADTSCLTREFIDGISGSFGKIERLNVSINHSTSPRTREARLGNIADAVAAGQIILDPNAHTTVDAGDGFTRVKLVESRDFQGQTNLDSDDLSAESDSDSADFDLFAENEIDAGDEEFLEFLSKKTEQEEREKIQQEKIQQEEREKAEHEKFMKMVSCLTKPDELSPPFSHLKTQKKATAPTPKQINGFYSRDAVETLDSEKEKIKKPILKTAETRKFRWPQKVSFDLPKVISGYLIGGQKH